MSLTVRKIDFQPKDAAFQDVLSEIEWKRKDFDSFSEAIKSPTPRFSSKEKNLQKGFQKVLTAVAYTSLLSLEIYMGFKYSFDMSRVQRFGLLTACSLLPTLGGLGAYQSSDQSYQVMREIGIRLQRASSYLFS